jgi:hypothetical protein
MQAALNSGDIALIAFAIIAAVFIWRSYRRRTAKARRL